MKKWIVMMLTATVISLSVAGCGGSNTAAPAAQPEAEAAEAEAEAGEPEAEATEAESGTPEAEATEAEAGTPEAEAGAPEDVSDGAEEEDKIPQEVTDLLVGVWMDRTSQRATMEIVRGEYVDEKDFCIKISWAGSYADAMVWEMNAEYDPASGELAYTNGRKAEVVYNDDSEVANESVEWEESEGAFTISDNELHWKDSKEEDAGNFVFERAYSDELPAEEYGKNILWPLASLETGTAGSSLKAAQTAQQILAYAATNQIWNIEPSSRTEQIRKAWGDLSDDERAAAVQNFAGEGAVMELIDGTFNDYEAVRGVFEDAGVGSDMEKLSGNIYARRSWETLRAMILALE